MIAQDETIAVRKRDVSGALFDDSSWDQRSSQNVEPFIEKHACQNIKMISVNVADGRKLAGRVAMVNSPSFDLVAGPLRVAGIVAFCGIPSLRPSKGLAKYVLRHVPNGVIRASDNASVPQFFSYLRMKSQEFSDGLTC